MYKEALRKFERIAEVASREDLNKISQIVLDELEKIAIAREAFRTIGGKFNVKGTLRKVNRGLGEVLTDKAKTTASSAVKGTRFNPLNSVKGLVRGAKKRNYNKVLNKDLDELGRAIGSELRKEETANAVKDTIKNTVKGTAAEATKSAPSGFNPLKKIKSGVSEGINTVKLKGANKKIDDLNKILGETTKANEGLKATNTVLAKNNKNLKGIATTGTMVGIGGAGYGLTQKKQINDDPNSAMY